MQSTNHYNSHNLNRISTTPSRPDTPSKRAASKFETGRCDLYISRNSSFAGQLERAYEMLSDGDAIVLHGLGAACHRAVNVALQLQGRFADTLKVRTKKPHNPLR